MTGAMWAVIILFLLMLAASAVMACILSGNISRAEERYWELEEDDD